MHTDPRGQKRPTRGCPVSARVTNDQDRPPPPRKHVTEGRQRTVAGKRGPGPDRKSRGPPEQIVVDGNRHGRSHRPRSALLYKRRTRPPRREGGGGTTIGGCRSAAAPCEGRFSTARRCLPAPVGRRWGQRATTRSSNSDRRFNQSIEVHVRVTPRHALFVAARVLDDLAVIGQASRFDEGD